MPLEGLDLSEQELLDCGYNGRSMNACQGAWVGAYSEWIAAPRKQKNGEKCKLGEQCAGGGGFHAHETDYPYQDRDPNKKCQFDKPKWFSGAMIDQAITDYSCDEDKLKKLLVKHGAVATGIYASDRGFKNSNKEVFDKCTSSRINHAVVVVGYGTQNGKDYW